MAGAVRVTGQAQFHDVVCTVDLVPPGVVTDGGEGNEWPGVHDRLLASQILVIASPTWLGRPSSVAQRVWGADGRDDV